MGAMAYAEITAPLGGRPGFALIGVTREAATPARRLRGSSDRFEAETWLVLPRARVLCPRCGPAGEAVPWLDRYQRMTTRPADAIARLAQVLSIKHVSSMSPRGSTAGTGT